MTVPGVLNNGSNGLRVCIASKLDRRSAETFVRAHIERLPFEMCVLHGVPPHTDERAGFVLHRPLWERLWRKATRAEQRSTDERDRTELIARFLRRASIDAVIAEYGEIGVSMTAACQAAAVPLVVHFHGHDVYNRSRVQELREQYTEMFSMAAAIVAVSRDMERELASLGAPADRIVWIPCGVDTREFSGGAPGSVEARFVAVGRFVETKSPHMTLLAFRKVLDACPAATLAMIGDGPLLGPCQHLAEYFGMTAAVEFSGAREHGFVREAMRRSRVFVQHSLRCLDGTCEGTPVSVMEAQSMGLPVVSTRHAGIPDVVSDGESGFLVEERDVDGMAERMIRLARDPVLATRLGEVGRQRVLAGFSSEITIGRLADVVNRATLQK